MDASTSDDLVIVVFRNRHTIFKHAFDLLCGVEEDILNLMGNVNKVLREDGETYTHVLVLPYKEGYVPGKEKPGFILPAVFRFASANIFTRKDGVLKTVRLKMPSFGEAVVGDFLDHFKVHRGVFSNVLRVENRFKKKLDVTRWHAAEHFGVHYLDVNEEQYYFQSMYNHARTMYRELDNHGLTIDIEKLRDFLIEHVSEAQPKEAGPQSIQDLLE